MGSDSEFSMGSVHVTIVTRLPLSHMKAEHAQKRSDTSSDTNHPVTVASAFLSHPLPLWQLRFEHTHFGFPDIGMKCQSNTQFCNPLAWMNNSPCLEWNAPGSTTIGFTPPVIVPVCVWIPSPSLLKKLENASGKQLLLMLELVALLPSCNSKFGFSHDGRLTSLWHRFGRGQSVTLIATWCCCGA